jgi:hypothetical protein
MENIMNWCKVLLYVASPTGVPTDPVEITRALHRLAAQDLLRAAGEGRTRYEFQVDVVRLWIEQFRSLAQPVQEILIAESQRA